MLRGLTRALVRALMLLPAALLAACAGTSAPAPKSGEQARLSLRLPPSALGESIALQQHLTVERNGKIDELDAALEVDADHVELVGLALGQRVLSLDYDGKQLKSWRHALLPAQVQAEDVLQDLQLVMWPQQSISAALPENWRIEDDGLHRTLSQNGLPVTVIDYSQLPRWSGTATLENLRYHYRLTIHSVPTGGAG
jgi:hypothetical protein